MSLGVVVPWIQGDRDSLSAEPIWVSCTLFGNQTVETTALCCSGAVHLVRRNPEMLVGVV